MFKSAILKLTGWYLLILMSISILFSAAIYQTATNEVSFRLDRYRNNFSQSQQPHFSGKDSFLIIEMNDASSRIIFELFLQNVFILIGGGLLSYLLAKRTLKTIEVAHESQTRFTSDASHELRTPLAAMKTEIEVALNDKNSTKSELVETLKSNLEEVDRLTVLSNMLLNLSRLDDKGLQKIAINARSITDKTISTFGSKAALIDNKTEKHIKILGDKIAIQDLLSILIDNALKHSPEKSKITISSLSQDKSSQIIVTNQGKISGRALPHIFDRFYREDKSRNANGFGLGLSLAKKISKAHKGNIRVENNIDNQVSFIISLPNA